MSYFLPDNYISRPGAVQDFEGEARRTDDCQKEVYEEAAKIYRDFKLETVIDLGTGSGWKFVKHFGQSPLDMIGIDLFPAVKILRERYPTYTWSTPDKLPMIAELRKPLGTGLVICSDMIEHVDDPDAVCRIIRSLRPRFAVISTPDRDLVDQHFHATVKTLGPPRNPCHVREWNFPQFGAYMASQFRVVRHFYSNVAQCTQCVVTIGSPTFRAEDEKAAN